MKQLLVRLFVYSASSGPKFISLLPASLQGLQHGATVHLRFVAFFAALDAAFRSVDLRGTFLRDVAILPTFEALNRAHDFSYSYVRPIHPHRLLLEKLLGCLSW